MVRKVVHVPLNQGKLAESIYTRMNKNGTCKYSKMILGCEYAWQ